MEIQKTHDHVVDKLKEELIQVKQERDALDETGDEARKKTELIF